MRPMVERELDEAKPCVGARGGWWRVRILTEDGTGGGSRADLDNMEPMRTTRRWIFLRHHWNRSHLAECHHSYYLLRRRRDCCRSLCDRHYHLLHRPRRRTTTHCRLALENLPASPSYMND
ncbi:Os09g0127400 [Oryza sativa Japonica Group]|uniref:Os09g0127400 protein n=1 Tax=Oryza sativa subsp. japonica TaxID=39947 RepID=A0A0P0XK21_ORYSJ|nr:Os09g0127400 [Oryza sativa Japonica Group]